MVSIKKIKYQPELITWMLVTMEMCYIIKQNPTTVFQRKQSEEAKVFRHHMTFSLF